MFHNHFFTLHSQILIWRESTLLQLLDGKDWLTLKEVLGSVSRNPTRGEEKVEDLFPEITFRTSFWNLCKDLLTCICLPKIPVKLVQPWGVDWFWYLSFLLAQMVSQKARFVGDIESGVQSQACAEPFLIGREDLVHLWRYQKRGHLHLRTHEIYLIAWQSSYRSNVVQVLYKLLLLWLHSWFEYLQRIIFENLMYGMRVTVQTKNMGD